MAFRDPAAAALVRTGELEPRLAEAERANEALVTELRGLAVRSPSERRKRWVRVGVRGAALGFAALWTISLSWFGPWATAYLLVASVGLGLATLWTVHAPVDGALILRRGRRRRVLAPGARRICLPGRVVIESLSMAPFRVQVMVEASGARLFLRGLLAVGLEPERLQRAAEQTGASSPAGLAGLATAIIADAASLAVARAVLEGTATDDWRGTGLRPPLEAALASVGLELLALTVTREPPPP